MSYSEINYLLPSLNHIIYTYTGYFRFFTLIVYTLHLCLELYVQISILYTHTWYFMSRHLYSTHILGTLCPNIYTLHIYLVLYVQISILYTYTWYFMSRYLYSTRTYTWYFVSRYLYTLQLPSVQKLAVMIYVLYYLSQVLLSTYFQELDRLVKYFFNIYIHCRPKEFTYI